MMCDFYGLLYYNDPEQDQNIGKRVVATDLSGETVEIPLNRHRHTGMLFGRIVSSRLLCDTSLGKPYRNLSETLLL